MSYRMRALSLLGCICGAMAAGGCMEKRVDLVGAGTVQLDVIQSRAAHISGVTVRQGQQDIQVSGLVRPEPPSAPPVRGHIDVEVSEPDGRTVQQNGIRVPQQRGHRGGRYSGFFHAYIPGRFADGSRVRVRYHVGKHENIGNQAPPGTRQST